MRGFLPGAGQAAFVVDAAILTRGGVRLVTVPRSKRPRGRPVEDAACLLVETRAVTGAIPAFLRFVPLHDAAQVRADRGEVEQIALLVAMHGDLPCSPPQNHAAAALDLGNGVAIAGRQQVAVLAHHVEIFARKLPDRAQAFSCRVVELCPGIGASCNEVADEDAGERTVRHSIAGITGGDIDVGVAGIAPDESEAVYRLHDLAGPFESDLSSPGKAPAHPELERIVRIGAGWGLSRLVILSADDEPVRSVVTLLYAHVVIRVLR